MAQSLYEKYGFEVISDVVHDFYGRVLKSKIAAPYFEGYNVPRIIHHQTQFLCSLLGGPNQYEGRDLATAHAALQITEEVFGEVADLLDETLEDHGVPDDERALILAKVAAAKTQVVTS